MVELTDEAALGALIDAWWAADTDDSLQAWLARHGVRVSRETTPNPSEGPECPS